MPPDNRPPRLGSNTLRSRARASGQIAEAKSQTRQRVAEGFETQEPEDVPVALEEGRLQPTTGFLDMARPMEAAAEFDSQFPRQDLGPEDVRETDRGFRPAGDVQRRKAAFQLDDQFPRQDLGAADVTATDEGFRADERTRRRATAFEFEDQTPLNDVDPRQDIQPREQGGFGLTMDRQRDVAAMQLDEQFPNQNLTAGDVTTTGEGFRADQQTQRRAAAFDLDEQIGLVDIGSGDVTQEGDSFGLTPAAEREVTAERIEEETPLDEVDPTGDLEQADGEFRLDQAAAERLFDLDRSFF